MAYFPSLPRAMTKSSILSLLFIALLLPATGRAAAKTQSKTHDAVITAVAENSITVQNGVHAGYKITNIGSDGTRETQGAANVDTYTIKPWTTVTLNGLPAKLSDLKPGLKVFVNQGTDPSVAESIVATAVPPPQVPKGTPVSKAAANKPPVKGAKGPKKLGQGVDAYKVTAVTADIITIAQDGGQKSISYKTSRFTDIIVNGERKSLTDVKVGMEVSVITNTDPTIASTIKANDP